MTPHSLSFYRPRTEYSITGGSGGGLTQFARCPRKYFYSSGCRLEPPGDRPALKFGEAIHAALPAAFFGDTIKAYADFLTVWKDAPGDDKRNPRTALLILEDFSDSHRDGRSIYQLTKPPGGIIRTTDQVSDYEIPFALDIGLPHALLVGRVDALAKHRDTGELWGVEWKTSSEMSTRLLEGFQLSPQILAYTLALRSYGIPVRGIIVEAIKVSVAKSKAQETISHPIFVEDSHLVDFLSWSRWIGNQIQASETTGQWPKDISACTTYPQFGSPGYQCEFMNLCQIEDWTVLEKMYARKEEKKFQIIAPEEAKP